MFMHPVCTSISTSKRIKGVQYIWFYKEKGLSLVRTKPIKDKENSYPQMHLLDWMSKPSLTVDRTVQQICSFVDPDAIKACVTL